MKALVVYDSVYGNTEKVAQTIGQAIAAPVLRAGDVKPADLKELELLIVGSPTHGGFPTKDVDALLKASPALHGIRVAAFDTRTRTTIFGHAAPRIAKRLEKSGANLLVPAEGFLVLDMKGPLKDGELERATLWAKSLTG